MSADLFEEATFHYCLGGRFNTDALSAKQSVNFADAKTLGNELAAAIRRTCPRLPPIHLDFVANPCINAWAFAYKGEYFIAIPQGTVEGIALLFERVLSDRRLWPDLGNGPLQTDPIRREFCDALVELALIFLFFHELHHILNGHVGYESAKHGSPFLAELGLAPRSPEEAIDRQMLEVDADICAAGSCVDAVGDIAKKPKSTIPQLRNWNDLLFAQLFAIFTLFRLFGDEPLARIDFYKRSHPPFRFRLRLVWETVRAIAQQRHSATYEQIDSTYKRAAFHAESASSFMTGEPLTEWIRYTEAFASPECREYYNRLLRRWKEGLRQELMPYAYGPPVEFYDPTSG
jgi:hypothetical protein